VIAERAPSRLDGAAGQDPDAPPSWALRAEPGGARLELSGAWTLGSALPSAAEVAARWRAQGGGVLIPELVAVTRWDGVLLAFLLALAQTVRAGGGTFDERGLPDALRRVLRPPEPAQAHPPPRPPRGLRRVGEWALARLTSFNAALELLGEVVLAFFRLLRGQARLYADDVWQVFSASSAHALPIVAIVNLLVGAILAFIGSVQLLQFGAGMYVADGVAIAMVREMAAVITAVVLAGRTGAAFAAQLATMQGNEEIDALRVLGVSPAEFLVLPRVLALTLMTPLLYLYACALGILGGLLVGSGMLELSAASYLDRTIGALNTHNFVLGASKSLVFGALVALSGCHYGLRAGRNAAAVGQAATTAVVTSIVGVIAVDALFAVCANALGV